MKIEIFDNDDKNYLKWLKNNPKGYVISMYRNRSPKNMTLHRATCICISKYTKMARKGGFTERKYIKICLISLREAQKWVSTNGRPNGTFSKECSKCNDNNKIKKNNYVGYQAFTPTAADISEPIDTKRIKTETYRILRDTSLARQIKKDHGCVCQICTEKLMMEKNAPYAEAHHIKPLGSPHNGPDKSDNIICVCPNCHALLDYGGIKLNLEQLNLNSKHKICAEYIDYHNKNILNRIILRD
jgi:hypothetical protein